MSDIRDAALLIKDRSGTYYALSREALEQARVAPEQLREVRRLRVSDDVSGYVEVIFMERIGAPAQPPIDGAEAAADSAPMSDQTSRADAHGSHCTP